MCSELRKQWESRALCLNNSYLVGRRNSEAKPIISKEAAATCVGREQFRWEHVWCSQCPYFCLCSDRVTESSFSYLPPSQLHSDLLFCEIVPIQQGNTMACAQLAAGRITFSVSLSWFHTQCLWFLSVFLPVPFQSSKECRLPLYDL